MPRNSEHDMLVESNAEEAARQRFVLALKGHLSGKFRPALRREYEQRAVADYRSSHGQPPAGLEQTGAALYANSIYRSWSAMARCAQEQMWRAVAAPLERQRAGLSERYRQLSQTAQGSLTLDPTVQAPDTMAQVQVHLQPGGYLRDEAADDVMAGALYEAGGRLYSQGEGVGLRENKAECVMRFLAEWAPDFTPRRILDLGCSAGASSVPWALAFPAAEVHAVDIGPALLRYAHARAESLGAAVHFHQARAEDTPFDAGSFDLVVSHNAMHEMSRATQQGIMSESFRLLRPGGICVHQDVPLRLGELDDYTRVLYSWDQCYNGEPFWSDYGNNDCAAMLQTAGFDPGSVHLGHFAQIDNSIRWFIAAARKA